MKTPGGYTWGLRWECPVCGDLSEASYRCTGCGADLAKRGSRERFGDRQVALARDFDRSRSASDRSVGASDARDNNSGEYVPA